MNDPGWDKIVDAIDAKFGVKNHGRKTEPLEDRADLNQTVSFIVFEKGEETYKLERVEKPAVVDRKTFGGHSGTAGRRIENIYDEEAVSHHTNFYKQAGEDWEIVNPEELSL